MFIFKKCSYFFHYYPYSPLLFEILIFGLYKNSFVHLEDNLNWTTWSAFCASNHFSHQFFPSLVTAFFMFLVIQSIQFTTLGPWSQIADFRVHPYGTLFSDLISFFNYSLQSLLFYLLCNTEFHLFTHNFFPFLPGEWTKLIKSFLLLFFLPSLLVIMKHNDA